MSTVETELNSNRLSPPFNAQGRMVTSPTKTHKFVTNSTTALMEIQMLSHAQVASFTMITKELALGQRAHSDKDAKRKTGRKKNLLMDSPARTRKS
jgi:hypothetical protein